MAHIVIDKYFSLFLKGFEDVSKPEAIVPLIHQILTKSFQNNKLWKKKP